MRRGRRVRPWLLALCCAVSACVPVDVVPPPALPPPRAPVEKLEPDTVEHRVGWIEFDPDWRGTSFGAYLAPKEDFADSTGGVDVIFHFHGGMLAEKEWRMTGVNAVVVSAAFGIGSNVYAAAFTDPARFGKMIDEVLASLRDAKRTGKLHARHVALVSWSAGYGSIGNILRVPKYFKMIDSVFLLDSLHAGFTPDHGVDLKALEPFVRLAKDAIAQKKLFVMTHSAILPPDYASTTFACARKALNSATRTERERGRSLFLRMPRHGFASTMPCCSRSLKPPSVWTNASAPPIMRSKLSA